jgi:putative ABC transport system permease protein
VFLRELRQRQAPVSWFPENFSIVARLIFRAKGARMRGARWLRGGPKLLTRDVLYAVRTLRRSPLFTAVAALTIALGIGASTALFSVANAVLLRPLPYKDPDRLAVMYMDLRARHNFAMPFSNENFTDIRNGSRGTIEEMAAVRTSRLVIPNADGTPEQVALGFVTTNFFRVMGAGIAHGRDFQDSDGLPQPQQQSPADARQPPLTVFAILSHEYWQRRFGGRADIVGTRLPNGPRPEVVGVLGPGFELTFPPADNVERRPDIWIASRQRYNNANRMTYGFRPVARLKSGVTLEQAQKEVEAAAVPIRKDFPIHQTAGFHARLEPMHAALVREIRPAILALMGGALFLLLIACANVANLLLVRASLRESELALRAALGAGRIRLVRQMLAEALVLTSVGAAIGVALAWAGLRQLLAAAPADVPRLDSVRLDATVIAFSAAIALASAVVFGMVPMWGAFRLDLTTAMQGTGRAAGLGGGRAAFRSGIVVAEVALCFVLLIGSGLMVRSFVALQRIDPGFDPRGMLTFQLLGDPPSQPEARRAIANQIADRLRTLPGVAAVTASFPFPLAGDFSSIRWGREEALADATKFQAVDWQIVRPGYFETMRTRLIAGRTFTEADNDPKRNLVVIDEVLAAKAFPNQSAVGQRILIRIRTPEPEFVEIIGVVGHQRVTSLADPGREQLYLAEGFLGFGARKWAVRTSGDPATYARAIRAAIGSIDPQSLMTDVLPAEALVRRAQAGTRFSLTLIAVFAAAAALLVAVGLYGVLATFVRQRVAEIGVRMAVGASPGQILRLVIGRGLRLSAAGIALGLAGAFILTQAMTTMLVGVRPTDPVTFLAMSCVFFVITALSSWLPARRAAALDPSTALRGG